MSDQEQGGALHPHRTWLFVASCISLLTTSMVFAIRGDIKMAMCADFHITSEQMGQIWSPAFWGFTISIFICGAIVDKLGMKLMHVLSGAGFIGGVLMILVAPKPDMLDGETVASIFDHTGTIMLFSGFLIMGLSQGIVEGVINPLAATVYPDKKGKMLNVLHAWWPGGMIIGGLLAFALSEANIGWHVKLGAIAVPAAIYLVMCIMKPYPQTERVAAKVSTGDMFKECIKPLFILLFLVMWVTAAVELGPDQWFPAVMTEIADVKTGGVLFLCYTAGLMFILRFFFGGVVHKFSPFGVLAVCSILVGVGLYWLGSLPVGTSMGVAFAAATVFGIGKTYFWPTMLGLVAERFPKGGALAMNLVGGAGMLSISVLLPQMGKWIDEVGAGGTLIRVSYLSVGLLVIFSLLYFAFMKKGGYKAEVIGGESEEDAKKAADEKADEAPTSDL